MVQKLKKIVFQFQVCLLHHFKFFSVLKNTHFLKNLKPDQYERKLKFNFNVFILERFSADSVEVVCSIFEATNSLTSPFSFPINSVELESNMEDGCAITSCANRYFTNPPPGLRR